MPSKSIKQKNFMTLVYLYKTKKIKNVSKEVKDAAKSMTKKQIKDFARTSPKGLPKEIKNKGDDSKINRLDDKDLENLIHLANSLDEKGFYKEADELDKITITAADATDYLRTMLSPVQRAADAANAFLQPQAANTTAPTTSSGQWRVPARDLPSTILDYLKNKGQRYLEYDFYIQNSRLYSDNAGISPGGVMIPLDDPKLTGGITSVLYRNSSDPAVKAIYDSLFKNPPRARSEQRVTQTPPSTPTPAASTPTPAASTPTPAPAPITTTNQNSIPRASRSTTSTQGDRGNSRQPQPTVASQPSQPSAQVSQPSQTSTQTSRIISWSKGGWDYSVNSNGGPITFKRKDTGFGGEIQDSDSRYKNILQDGKSKLNQDDGKAIEELLIRR